MPLPRSIAGIRNTSECDETSAATSATNAVIPALVATTRRPLWIIQGWRLVGAAAGVDRAHDHQLGRRDQGLDKDRAGSEPVDPGHPAHQDPAGGRATFERGAEGDRPVLGHRLPERHHHRVSAVPPGAPSHGVAHPASARTLPPPPYLRSAPPVAASSGGRWGEGAPADRILRGDERRRRRNRPAAARISRAEPGGPGSPGPDR